eukprot:TRINITY_DN5412_c0_g1_i1.p1 TRINITY_DN5412_c0_g1~~TRINITY_DN5412_c0_g1_i1.p1  ORF type:complete len:150 (+),score=5.00 TRINITY_DN5412_c0_g1_i1:79-528(+)
MMLSRSSNCTFNRGKSRFDEPVSANNQFSSCPSSIPQMNLKMAQHAGGCNCGTVRFHFTKPIGFVVECHCDQCRKFTGHFGVLGVVPHDTWKFDKGEDNITWFKDPAKPPQRGFCKTCGSSLFQKREDNTHALVLMGVLDKPTNLTQKW